MNGKSYRKGCDDGTTFEVRMLGMRLGFTTTTSPDAATAARWARNRFHMTGRVEVLKHLPGSRLGATFVESAGVFDLGKTTVARVEA